VPRARRPVGLPRARRRRNRDGQPLAAVESSPLPRGRDTRSCTGSRARPRRSRRATAGARRGCSRRPGRRRARRTRRAPRSKPSALPSSSDVPVSLPTARTGAVAERERNDDAVARREPVDGVADGNHFAGGLVAEHLSAGTRSSAHSPWPAHACQSLRQTPQAVTRTTAPSGPGSGSGTSWMSSGSPYSREDRRAHTTTTIRRRLKLRSALGRHLRYLDPPPCSV